MVLRPPGDGSGGHTSGEPVDSQSRGYRSGFWRRTNQPATATTMNAPMSADKNPPPSKMSCVSKAEENGEDQVAEESTGETDSDRHKPGGGLAHLPEQVTWRHRPRDHTDDEAEQNRTHHLNQPSVGGTRCSHCGRAAHS